MKLDSITRFEVQAEAFRVMTGHMAPGKDVPAAGCGEPYEERAAIFDRWIEIHGECVRAMLQAFENVIAGDLEGADRVPGPEEVIFSAADEIERLRMALAEIREVYAGSELGKPIYAQEAYAIDRLKEMYKIAVKTLRSNVDIGNR